jgi:hypothetical protein
MPFDVLSRRLEQVTAWLFGMRFGRFVALVLGLAVLRNGLWFVPNVDLVRQISLDPTTCPELIRTFPPVQYLMSSYLGPLLAWLLRANGDYLVFALLHLALFLALFPVVLWQARRKFGDPFARCLGIAFAVLPVSTTVFTWLGNSDTFTVLLGSAVFLCESVVVLLPAGFLLGVNHFEQGVLIVLLTALSQWFIAGPVPLSPRKRVAWVWAALGLALGKAALSRWFAAHHFPLAAGRLEWVMATGLSHFATMFVVNLLPLLFSLFNVFWAAVLLLGLVIAGKYPRRLMELAVLCGLALATAALTYDATRVFALLCWPVVLAFLLLALHVDPAPHAGTRKLMTAVLASGLVVPPLMVWAGNIHSGVLAHTLRLACATLANGLRLPEGETFQPGYPFQRWSVDPPQTKTSWRRPSVVPPSGIRPLPGLAQHLEALGEGRLAAGADDEVAPLLRHLGRRQSAGDVGLQLAHPLAPRRGAGEALARVDDEERRHQHEQAAGDEGARGLTADEVGQAEGGHRRGGVARLEAGLRPEHAAPPADTGRQAEHRRAETQEAQCPQALGRHAPNVVR